MTAALSYDPAGRLRQTTINGVTTHFLYSGEDLIAEMDSAGAILRRYIHGPGVNNPMVWIEGATMAASGVRYLYKDRLGSITSWTNSAGVVQATFAYGPYGEPKTWGGSRFGYTGQVALSELGLYYWVYPRKGPKRDIGFEANGRRLGRCRHTDFQDQTSRCCEINERVQRELAELAS